MVEDLVLLLGAGGECLDDLTILAADQGLLRLCGCGSQVQDAA